MSRCLPESLALVIGWMWVTLARGLRRVVAPAPLAEAPPVRALALWQALGRLPLGPVPPAGQGGQPFADPARSGSSHGPRPWSCRKTADRSAQGDP